jgi:hypothetical protein
VPSVSVKKMKRLSAAPLVLALNDIDPLEPLAPAPTTLTTSDTATPFTRNDPVGPIEEPLLRFASTAQLVEALAAL